MGGLPTAAACAACPDRHSRRARFPLPCPLPPSLQVPDGVITYVTGTGVVISEAIVAGAGLGGAHLGWGWQPGVLGV